MKNKFRLFLLITTLLVIASCKTRNLELKTPLPKIENQLKGELDYTKGGLEVIQYQNNGDEITIGNIDKTGTVHFNLPEFDIKANYKNQGNANFHHQFEMTGCPGKGLFDKAQPPYDAIYSQIYAPLYIKKYDIIVAFLYPISDEKILEHYNKIIGSQYYWFYIDRAIDYNEECIKTYSNAPDNEVNVSADIQFKKGWNFIKKNNVAVQNYGVNNEKVIPKKIHFTRISPESKEIKWFIKQRTDDEKIQAAKKAYNSTLIKKD